MSNKTKHKSAEEITIPCENCKGTGDVSGSKSQNVWDECPVCHGVGEVVDYASQPCSKCEEKDKHIKGVWDVIKKYEEALLRFNEEEDKWESQLAEANKKCEEKDKQIAEERDTHHWTENGLNDVVTSWREKVANLQSQLSEANKEIERLKQTKP
jgi:predicted RNase H-like nuclease (RuvC/YqgF family)